MPVLFINPITATLAVAGLTAYAVYKACEKDSCTVTTPLGKIEGSNNKRLGL